MNDPKQPVWFTDWRAIWHAESRHLAYAVVHRFDGRRITMDRYLWKQIHRVKRIEKRLEVEREVKDKSYLAELFRMIQQHDR